MKIRHLLPCLLLFCAAPPLVGQVEPLDSILARLERAERLIEVLQAQVADQAENKVEPAAGGTLELFGHILVNGFFTSQRTNNSDLPLVVLPPDPPGGLPAGGVGGTLRQTRVGLRATHSDVLGAELLGEVEFNLFGGHIGDGRLRPILSMRRARVELRWSQVWVLFGQEAPPIASVNPSSLAALDFPGFTISGNLWFWMPQARIGIQTATPVAVGFELAAIAPFSLPQSASIATTFTAAERSNRPMIEGRLLARWGDQDIDGGEVSLGGHLGWFATTGDSTLTSKGAAVAVRTFVTEFVELRGEAFIGEALTVLGGGGAGQNFGVGGVPVRTVGGWGQVNFLPYPEWEIGAGFGMDDPDDADLTPGGGTLQNKSWETHVTWRPRPLLFGVELRRIFTTYGDPTIGEQGATHLNLAMGLQF